MPINTSNATKAIAGLKNMTAGAAKTHAAKAAAAAAQTAQHTVAKAGGGIDLTTLMIGLLIVMFILLVIVLVVRRVLRISGAISPKAQLERSMREKAAEAIALLLNASSGRAHFRPLYSLGDIFYYRVGNNIRYFIPTVRKPWSFGDKLLYVGLEYDNVGIELDPCNITQLAVARSGDESPRPRNLKELLLRLAEKATQRSSAAETPDGLAFEAAPTEEANAITNYIAKLSEAVIKAQSGLWSNIEQTSKLISGGLTQQLLSPRSAMALLILMIGIAVVFLLLNVANIALAPMHGPTG